MTHGFEVFALALTLAAANPYETPATRDPGLAVGHRLRVDYLRREEGSMPGVPLLRPVRRAGLITVMDSIALALEVKPERPALHIPYEDIEALAVSEGLSRRDGMVFGALVGAAIAGGLAILADAALFDRDDPDRNEIGLLGVGLSATAGGIAGGFYGNTQPRESWRAIPVRSLWVSR